MDTCTQGFSQNGGALPPSLTTNNNDYASNQELAQCRKQILLEADGGKRLQRLGYQVQRGLRGVLLPTNDK